MNKHSISALLKSIQDYLDVLWYERDKSQEPGPYIVWRAIWPEGGQHTKGVANFAATLYLSAPSKQAALYEFQRWAELRMQDIPYVVLEQVDIKDIPCCPQPCFDNSGEAVKGVWNRLA